MQRAAPPAHRRPRTTTPQLQTRNRQRTNLSQSRRRRTPLRMCNGADNHDTRRHGTVGTPTGARTMDSATAPGAASKEIGSGGVSATGPSAQPPVRVEMKEATRRPRRTLGGRAEQNDGNHVATATRAVPLDLPDPGGGTTRGRRARSRRRRSSNRTRPVRRRMTVPARTFLSTYPAARTGGRSGAAMAGIDLAADAGMNNVRANASASATGRSGTLCHGGDASGVIRAGIQRISCNFKRTMRREMARPTTVPQSGTRTCQFHVCNRAEAVNIMRACCCALCKTYDRIRRLDKGRILRGTRAWMHTLRRPSSATGLRAMREWAAMLFWCAHPSSVSAWESLHRRARNYIATCMATPPQWNLEWKVVFARARVAQLWQDASIVIVIGCPR